MTDREKIAERLREGMCRDAKVPLTDEAARRMENDPYVLLAPTVEDLIRDAAQRAWRDGQRAQASNANAAGEFPWPMTALPADFALVEDKP